jgi:hypothetical protein
MVEDSSDPPGVNESYYHLRSAERNVPAGLDWWDLMRDEMYPQGIAVAEGA